MTGGSHRRRFRNQLLAGLSDDDIGPLTPVLEEVTLTPGQVLEQPGMSVEHVYFPESGTASVIAVDGAHRRMEAGPFGRDGMSGLSVVTYADSSPNETRVQLAGTAHRLPATIIRDLMEHSLPARRLLLRYVHAFAIQTAHTALAAGIAVVEQRLARWILMLHDRADGDELLLTHEFMALMLAVRRPGVTVALHELEGKALIRSLRGRVVIRDRAGLEEFCAGLYGVAEAEYRRLIVPYEGGSSG